MLTLNKYLRELGYNEKSWPFDEIKENTDIFLSGSKNYDGRYVHQAPLKDGTIEENFVNAECFSLDSTLAMIIYSYLCYFRDHGADQVTPGCFCYNSNGKENKNGHEQWMKCLNDMITAFRLYLKDDDTTGLYGGEYKKYYSRKNRRINYGMKQFIKYFGCLWL